MRRGLSIALALVAAGAAVFASDYLAPARAVSAGAADGARRGAGEVPVEEGLRSAALQERRAREEPVAQAFPGNVEYDGRLVFVRIRYNAGFGGAGFRGSRGEPPWAHDYPTADIHLMKILKELTLANPLVEASNVLTLDDPALCDYPIAYMSEPGHWSMSDEEAMGLRRFLQKGGFIIFDDFQGNHWYNLEEQMKRVMPELRWVALEPSQTIFNTFFEIKNFDFGYYGKETYYGMFEDNDPTKRLLAIGGHNQDLGEFWEFSDQGFMPVDLSNEAYKFGVNYFVYGLIH